MQLRRIPHCLTLGSWLRQGRPVKSACNYGNFWSARSAIHMSVFNQVRQRYVHLFATESFRLALMHISPWTRWHRCVCVRARVSVDLIFETYEYWFLYLLFYLHCISLGSIFFQCVFVCSKQTEWLWLKIVLFMCLCFLKVTQLQSISNLYVVSAPFSVLWLWQWR